MTAPDSGLERVYDALLEMDPDGSRTGRVLRETLDQLYDGQNTGRYRWEQLHKTEKTHCGTLVEINLHREFKFSDGLDLDYTIAGHDVDCKYSQRDGGWMIPSEAHGELCLVVTADDTKSTWSAGLIRATVARLNLGRNRDAKATITKTARADIHWLTRDGALPPNVLLQLPQADQNAIFALRPGQKRLDELFRRTLGRRVGRGVVATVAQQSDYMKRIRFNGGSRGHLAPEGIIILGDTRNHQWIAAALDAEVPQKGESVAVRVVPAEKEWDGPGVESEGRLWRRARADDPVVRAPTMANPRVAVGSLR